MTGWGSGESIVSDGLGSRTGVADAVVVGGGTVGAWCAWFLKQAGLSRVVLLEQGALGQGASSRAAGIVRSQGGTPTAVRLAEWTRAFYRSQSERLAIDSGFVRQGYYLPCFSEADEEAARERLAMQQAEGMDVAWVDAADAEALNPNMAPGLARGGTFHAEDGWIHPPRNVLAYTAAMLAAGVEVHERTAFLGLEERHGHLVAVETSRGRLPTGRLVLTGGPELAEVGRRAGTTIPSGGARHQVAVTAPHPDLQAGDWPMVFDLQAGLYWRPEEGGLLFGMSNPAEEPGEAREIDGAYLALMQERLATLVPVTRDLPLRRIWVGTIDYTPDHLPILGPVLRHGEPVEGTTVASAGGHGMMWGPGVSRVAADLALEGTSALVDASILGLDRFDGQGRSRLATDPIALPFPEVTGQVATGLG